MMIDSQRLLTYCCPSCGRLTRMKTSIFTCLQDSPFVCSSCGEECISITKKRNLIILQDFCMVCGEPHVYRMPAGEFWNCGLFILYCDETGLETAFWGREDEVDDAIAHRASSQLERILEAANVDDVSDMAILKILDHIHDIATMGALTCECGSDNIELVMNEGAIKLICKDCSSVISLNISTPESFMKIQKMDRITIPKIK